MNDKEITVITPTYNRKDTLPRLYESLCNQTYKNFIWLIMDDGSTDGTTELIKKYQLENKVQIEYHWHENVQQMVTVFRGFGLVKTPYHFRVDSDDSLPDNSLEILYREMIKIKDDNRYCAVVGRLQDQNGQINGTDFPENPLDTTAFLMKNKYKVAGVHAGLQKISAVRSLNLNMEKYAGKYTPNFWYFVLDSKYITRFINEVVYTYHFDIADAKSNTNARKKKKNAFGLKESSQCFLQSYAEKYFKEYPLPILKQLFRYIYYGRSEGNSHSFLMKNIKSGNLKFWYILLIIPVFFYSLKNPMK